MYSKTKIQSLIIFLLFSMLLPGIIFAQTQQGYQRNDWSGNSGLTNGQPSSSGAYMPGAVFSNDQLQQLMFSNSDFSVAFSNLAKKLANDELTALQSGGNSDATRQALEDKFVSDANQLYLKYKNGLKQGGNNITSSQNSSQNSSQKKSSPSLGSAVRSMFSNIYNSVSNFIGNFLGLFSKKKDSNTPNQNRAVTADVNSIFSNYCSGSVSISYKNTDYSNVLTTKLASLKIGDLMSNLAGGVYQDNQIPEVLQYIGLKSIQAGNIDDGIRFYLCASEKYYDMFSMYRMATLYSTGTDGLKKIFPNAVVTSSINIDPKEEYFWVVSMMYVELAEKTGKLDTSTQLGWNVIAMLDDLQNTGKVTKNEMVDIENNVRTFIGKRYTNILDNNTRFSSW